MKKLYLVLFLFKCLNLFSAQHEDYLEKQLNFQYRNEVISKYKRVLDFSSFEPELTEFSKRYHEIKKNILNKKISDIHLAIGENIFSTEELVLFYLYRIHKHDHKYNSIIELNKNVLKEARKLDSMLKKDKTLLTGLCGIPVLLKDNIAVKGII